MAQQTCHAMCDAGVLDFVAPQYYDMSGPPRDQDARIRYAVAASHEWLSVMHGSASKLGLGYGITPAVTQTMCLASRFRVGK